MWVIGLIVGALIGAIGGAGGALVGAIVGTIVGSDRYKYNVGVGALILAGSGVDATFEVSFLGEQRVTTGLGFSF